MNLDSIAVLALVPRGFRPRVQRLLIYGQAANEVLMLTDDDQMYAIGTNYFGCLGLGHSRAVLEPTRVAPLCDRRVVQMAAGNGPHALVLTADSQLYSFGTNTYCQLGTGTLNQQTTPFAIPTAIGQTKIKQISCGGHHCAFVTENGALYAWGHNNMGQVGVGGTAPQPQVRRVQGAELKDKKIVQVACGLAYTIALDSDGVVYGWGQNGSAQLGQGKQNLTNQSYPVKIGGGLADRKVKQVAVGHNFVMARTVDGSLYTWGCNTFGQLGHSHRKVVHTPTVVTTFLAEPPSDVETAMQSTQRHGTVAVIDANQGDPLSSGQTNQAQGSSQQIRMPIAHDGSNDSGSRSRDASPPSTAPTILIADIEAHFHTSCAVCVTHVGNVYIAGLVRGQSTARFFRAPFDGAAAVFVQSPPHLTPGQLCRTASCPCREVRAPCFAERTSDDVENTFDACRMHCYDAASSFSETGCVSSVVQSIDNLSLRKSLASHFNDEVTSDVVFKFSGGQSISAHRSFLAMRSAYFRSLLGKPWAEASRTSIDISDVDYASFVGLLRFLYTEKVDIEECICDGGGTSDQLMFLVDLLKLSDNLCETGLKKYVEARLAGMVDVETAAMLYDAATTFNCSTQFRDFVLRFAVTRLTAVVQSTSFALVQPSTMRELMLEAAKARAFKF